MPRGILDGVKVLDFTIAFVGTFCTRIMRDMGADVIKIERPIGQARGGFAQGSDRFTSGARDVSFLHLNGGKKSVCVDMKNPKGVELVHSLVPKVDILAENFTPHVMANFGLDYANASRLNPKIVMASMTGYGQQGWNNNLDHTCTDPIATAMAGLNWITGPSDGPPYTIGGGIGDTITGLTGAMAIGYALYDAQRTGKGQHIDLSMIEANMFIESTVMPYVAANKGNNIHHRNGQQNTYTFPMGTLKCRDGYIALQAPGEGPESPWARLCQIIGRPEMVEDPRYKTQENRIKRTQEVVDILEGYFVSLPSRDVALQQLAEARISSGPVLSQEQILVHPHFRERGAFQTIDYPELGPVEVVAPPYKYSETPAFVRGPAPQLGEHNYDVLHEQFGMSLKEVQALTEEGVLVESEGARRRQAARS